ncbi:MAG: hypothetical protein CR974_04270 [Gammaproteobacteria bacterium]|nr:MAG: hypothetical protein CR974_04270 [Gammaproteobacteria bacterium]
MLKKNFSPKWPALCLAISLATAAQAQQASDEQPTADKPASVTVPASPAKAEKADKAATLTANAALLARTDKLLAKAVEHVKANGADSVRDFTRLAKFIDKELYVYALDINGTFLASGGDSEALSGSNVLSYTDANGKQFFRELVKKAAESDNGEVKYHWFNPGGGLTPKVAHYNRVGDVIIAVGYHAPRSTEKDARVLLARAMEAWKADAEGAKKSFHEFGDFLRGDLYVFVINKQDGTVIVNGLAPELEGKDGRKIADEGGNHFIQQMIDRADKQAGIQKIVYRWPNPLSESVERKHSYFAAEGDVIIGVGNYLREF